MLVVLQRVSPGTRLSTDGHAHLGDPEVVEGCDYRPLQIGGRLKMSYPSGVLLAGVDSRAWLLTVCIAEEVKLNADENLATTTRQDILVGRLLPKFKNLHSSSLCCIQKAHSSSKGILQLSIPTLRINHYCIPLHISTLSPRQLLVSSLIE